MKISKSKADNFAESAGMPMIQSKSGRNAMEGLNGSVDRALQDLTFQVLRLENAAAQVIAISGDPVTLSNARWTFDPPPPPNPTTAKTPATSRSKPAVMRNTSTRSTRRASLQRHSRNDPSVGSYEPNYDLVHKNAPSFSFSFSKRTVTSKLRTQARECKRGESKDRAGKGRVEGCAGQGQELCTMSRFKRSKAVVFGKSTRDCTAVRGVAEGPGFAYAHQGSIVSKTIGSLPPTQRPKLERKRKDDDDGLEVMKLKQKGSERGDYNTEKALRSVEPRVCGVISWKPVEGSKGKRERKGKSKSKRGRNVGELSLDIDKAHTAVHPRVKGVVSWGPPLDTRRSNSQKLPVVESPGATVAGSILQASFQCTSVAGLDNASCASHGELAAKEQPGKASFDTKIHFKIRKPSAPTPQLVEHRQRKLDEAARLGPGRYDCEQDRRPKQLETSSIRKLRKERPKVKHVSKEKEVGAAFYDVDKADGLTKKRVLGVQDFSKGSARFASTAALETEALCVAAKQKPSSLHSDRTDQVVHTEYEEKHASSSDEEKSADDDNHSTSSSCDYFTSSSTDEGKCDSDTSNTSASSSVTAEDSMAQPKEELYAWRNMRRVSRRKTNLRGRMKQKRELPSAAITSTWAKPSYEQTLVGRKYLALRQHKRRKRDEAQGPARSYEASDEAIRPSVRGITRYDHSKRRTVPRKPKAKPKVKSKEEVLIERLGLTDLIVENAQQLPTSQLPPEHIPTALIKRPVTPSEQLKNLRALQADEARRLGPGTYDVSSHDASKEETERTAELLTQLREAKTALKKAQTECDRAAAEQDLASARAAWSEFQQDQPFHKLPGRPKERVDRENGPGTYSLPPGVTRYGAENVKGVIDFSRTARDDALSPQERAGNGGDTLQLEAISLDAVKPSKPGARGFSFSKMARPVSIQHDELSIGASDGKDAKLNLEPNYTFGKFSEAGKGLVELQKMTGRQTYEIPVDDAPILDLDPKRADHLVNPRIKGLSFGKMKDRGLTSTPSSPCEAYHDAVYSPHADEAVKVLVDYSRGQERWQSEPSPYDDFVHVRGDEELPRDPGAIGAGPAALDMAKQSERWPDEAAAGDTQLPYKDAVYDATNTSPLGGLNAKAKARRGSSKIVSFQRQSKRWAETCIDSEQQAHSDTHVDKDAPLAVERARKRTDTGVAMNKQSKRWSDVGAKPRAPSPDQVLVESGLKHVTRTETNQLWTIPMAKTKGRDNLFHTDTTNDDVSIKTDVLGALEAPSQKPRVLGGVIPKSERSSLASKIQRNPDAPPLNPNDDALRPKRDKGVLDMRRAQGRPEDDHARTGSTSIEMTEPPKPDIRRALLALKARIPGGDSALKPATGAEDSRPLQLRRKAKEAEDSQQRAKFTTNTDTRRRAIQEDRRARLEHAKSHGAKEKEKRKLRAAEKKKLEEKNNWTDIRDGLRLLARNRMNKKRIH